MEEIEHLLKLQTMTNSIFEFDYEIIGTYKEKKIDELNQIIKSKSKYQFDDEILYFYGKITHIDDITVYLSPFLDFEDIVEDFIVGTIVNIQIVTPDINDEE